MTDVLTANASPEKHLFISLLTRDIPLTAAFLDLIDNSINAAVEPFAHRLKNAKDYLDVFADETVTPSVDISLQVSRDRIEIRDGAKGISSKTAQEHVFKFGRAQGERHPGDRLSVYGIGLKRAMFKLGNKIVMRSDHADGGFDLNLDVAKWEKDTSQPWTFSITSRPPAEPEACGTSIVITQLYDEVERRVSDGVFEGQLREGIARAYSYYLAKFVSISLNGKAVEGISIELGDNHTSEAFADGNVSCAITAGIGIPQAGAYRDRSSGWFVFCNGRVVVSADKSALTGWSGTGLPIFQPKHRPFLGTVFFVSDDVEQLPWTTTKSALNEDSAVWQLAKRRMTTLGRTVISFLDGRYTDEGTEIASKALQEASGTTRVSVLVAAVSSAQSFSPPSTPAPITRRIQYDAHLDEIKKIASYLKRPSMSGSDIGRFTFQYFLRNEVEES